MEQDGGWVRPGDCCLRPKVLVGGHNIYLLFAQENENTNWTRQERKFPVKSVIQLQAAQCGERCFPLEERRKTNSYAWKFISQAAKKSLHHPFSSRARNKTLSIGNRVQKLALVFILAQWDSVLDRNWSPCMKARAHKWSFLDHPQNQAEVCVLIGLTGISDCMISRLDKQSSSWNCVKYNPD